MISQNPYLRDLAQMETARDKRSYVRETGIQRNEHQGVVAESLVKHRRTSTQAS